MNQAPRRGTQPTPLLGVGFPPVRIIEGVKVIIAGAGIGGLSAALSLHAAGIDAIVIDSAASLRPLGVGINLMPHAVRELTELGLGGDLEATGIPPLRWCTSTGTATGSGA